MPQIRMIALALLVPLLVSSSRSMPDATKAQVKPENKLLGTWKLISGKYDGQEFSFPEGTTMLKHVTSAQFMWVTYDKDGKVFRAAGGSYSLNGNTYEETPAYGMSDDFELIKGKSHSFTWKV